MARATQLASPGGTVCTWCRRHRGIAYSEEPVPHSARNRLSERNRRGGLESLTAGWRGSLATYLDSNCQVGQSMGGIVVRVPLEF